MPEIDLAFRAAKRFAVAALLADTGLAAGGARRNPDAVCDAPLDMIRFANPLSRVSQKLNNGEPITIVAIGSSSTAGAGASSPAANYPSRLQAELKQRFPGHPITVFNRGVNGEEVADMLKRFDAAVIAVKPDLVIWQLGTNSVLRDHQARRPRRVDPRRPRQDPRDRRRYRSDRSAIRAEGHRQAGSRAHGRTDSPHRQA